MASTHTFTAFAKGTRGEYELVVLHPDYFSIHNSGVVIKHPVTQDFQIFYCSQYKDGHLREGSPTGPILPPLCSRGKINRLIPLNPILVNYAAVIRFKCLIRRDSTWKSLLSPYVVEILRGVAELHEAINWKPNQPTAPETTSGRTDQDWPYDLALGGAPQPSPSAPDPNQGIETALDRAFALLEAGDSNCAYKTTSRSDCVCDMKGLWTPRTCTTNSSVPEVMNSEEKMGIFLTTFDLSSANASTPYTRGGVLGYPAQWRLLNRKLVPKMTCMYFKNRCSRHQNQVEHSCFPPSFVTVARFLALHNRRLRCKASRAKPKSLSLS